MNRCEREGEAIRAPVLGHSLAPGDTHSVMSLISNLKTNIFNYRESDYNGSMMMINIITNLYNIHDSPSLLSFFLKALGSHVSLAK